MRIIALILTLFFASSALCAPDSVKVVAIVNEQIISSVDLDERTGLIMATTGIPDTDENRVRLLPQILHQLIDEKLQMQEAAANSITISDAKVHEAIARIEKQNGKAPGSLEEFLDSRHVSKPSFYAQIRAQASWAEIVLKKVKPRIRVSDQEVARYVKRKSESAGSPKSQEVMIATIQLPVDSPQNEAAVHKVADKLAEEIHSGRSFEAIATQFSSGSGGKATDPFWVELSQLDPAISAALGKISKGGVTEPVKTENGYQLIKLVDTRQAQAGGEPQEATPAPASVPRSELAFRQIIMTAKPAAKKKDPESLLQQAKQVAGAPGKCTDKTIAPAKGVSDLNFDISLIRRISTNLPEKLRDILAGLKVGATSTPVVTAQDIRVFTLCERMDLPPEKPAAASVSAKTAADDAIRQAIYEEKLELEAQKYLRNLRREGFVEIRGM